MYNLPSQLNILNISINTFGVFMLFGFILLAFVVWREGRRDGFDEEKVFDILLISVFFGLLLSRLLFALKNSVTSSAFLDSVLKIWTSGFDPLGALIGFIIPMFILSKMWKWSFYRIADIFSMGMSMALSVVTLGYVGLQGKFTYLFAFAAWLFLFAFLAALRNTKISSGYGFCAFLILNSVLGAYFFGIGSNLLFYISLVTLGFVVFLLRWRLSNDKLISRIIARIKK